MGHEHDDRALILAINAHSKNTGKWLSAINETLGAGLAAIAIAAASSEDNSAEIKKLTDQLRANREALKTAIDNQEGEK